MHVFKYLIGDIEMYRGKLSIVVNAHKKRTIVISIPHWCANERSYDNSCESKSLILVPFWTMP